MGIAEITLGRSKFEYYRHESNLNLTGCDKPITNHSGKYGKYKQLPYHKMVNQINPQNEEAQNSFIEAYFLQ